MCVKREGVGNFCGGLFTILMLIIMFSVAHRRFHELIYISLAFIAITLTLCIIYAIFNTLCRGESLIDYWDYAYNSRNSFRYRHQNYNNNHTNNGQNQQRVHVCAPPNMGGARLNIIYTIGQQNNMVRSNVLSNQTLPNENHSFAINIDNNSRLSSHIMPINSNLYSGSTPPYGRSQYFQFSPIITLMANNNQNNDNISRIINSYEEFPIDSRIQLENETINGMSFQISDLPPLYHQLDVISNDGPPTYEEAIEDKGMKK